MRRNRVPDQRQPILEIETGGAAKHYGLTLNDIEAARRLADEGSLADDEIEKQYPNWREAARAVDTTLAEAAATMQTVLSPISAALKDLDLSRLGLTEQIRSLGESMARVPEFSIPKLAPLSDLPLHLRDPDEATREVRDEVRDLAQITKGLLEATRATTEAVSALLSQTRTLAVTVQTLHNTTSQGVLAEERRAVAGERRERVLIALTVALVALAIPLAVSEFRSIWHDTEAGRNIWQDAEGIWNTAQALLSAILRAMGRA